MRYSNYDTEALRREAAERMAGYHHWAANERMAGELRRPGSLRLVRLTLVLLAAGFLAALLMVAL